MGCCMGSTKRNSNNTGGSTDPNDDPSDDGTIPYWSSPGGAATSNNASNKTGGPYAGSSKSAQSNFKPINTDGICNAGSIGAVSQQYESNGNAGSIGYDSTGGQSYGLYQLSSSRGSMTTFMQYLQVNDADAYSRLSSSGSVGSSAFNTAWKNEAATNSKFAGEQECYVKQMYYDNSANYIKSRYGVDINKQPLAVQQAVWSTSVQMGQHSSVFDKTFSTLPSDASSSDIINRMYDERGRTTSSGSLVYFSSSSASVQASVANRFSKERNELLNL